LETAIGVFSSRERAEEAVQELLDKKVPREAIVFLTRSETEATAVGKELGATVGGFMGFATGMSAGVGAALLLVVPGIGQVFALGFGAAALLGLAGAGAGSALGKSVAGESGGAQPTPEKKSPEDVAFFREVLAEGRSLVVVRTESHETAGVANGILNRLGIGIQEHIPVKMQTATRQIADIAVVDVRGRITAGEGTLVLREVVRELLNKGSKKILLNLYEVGYVDSSGLGELVKTYTTVRSQGGQLKLVQISKRVQDLLQMTKLHAVFDIQSDEATAIQSFEATAASRPETAR
jgi:anti-sigma B factor antagonist